eukprot:CAMPEP_0194209740 /NCGR_PEP_ID=MMETSP0156-20130528/7761_1 /TAXON_ID=33649 /ORGANISM="Thalassionema nitzschioides, Strain L26-B" /LENGTH=81 /DNA_ID=CAMNT_0038936953 /DNA_START=150 /DNA_END=392 /DNA_ORIENTATION=-
MPPPPNSGWGSRWIMVRSMPLPPPPPPVFREWLIRTALEEMGLQCAAVRMTSGATTEAPQPPQLTKKGYSSTPASLPPTMR